MDQNDWAAEMFTFNGNSYPIGQAGWGASQGSEEIENDFEGYAQSGFKGSGIVFAVMLARMQVFTEARFQYQKLIKGRPGDLFGLPALSIFERPWPNGQTPDLMARAIQDADLAGNHYVVTEGVGANRRLRRLRPNWVEIVLTAPPDQSVKSDVAGYIYRPGGTMNDKLWKWYPIDGSMGIVAHWAPIPDPEAQYRGMSWLTPVLPEIVGDRAMMKHKNKFFANAATPAITVSLKETVTEEQFKAFMKNINRSHQGVDNAYKTLYLGGGADVKVIGTTLQQMDFTATAGHGETRIAAAGGVPPPLIPIAENMHGATLNQGNFVASKNLFVDKTMRPLWRGISNAYSVLVPELVNSKGMSTARLWYDDRDIPFLRQDRKDIAELQSQGATTINGYITAGFTPESSVAAYVQEDPTLLKHTGLFSVQLQPPIDPNAPTPDANKPGPAGQGANKPDPDEGSEDDDEPNSTDDPDEGGNTT